MSKNLIVCSDGTGNIGGSTPSSNVYKVYKAVDKHYKGEEHGDSQIDEQIVFYDNGVGTEKNKYRRLIGGAFGFGFKENVCDLYRFLCRYYEPGDRIYFFGFSRGASTVRACIGFINTCGLRKGKGLRSRELNKLVVDAFKAYKNHIKEPEKAEEIKKSKDSHENIRIHFVGIWDTVVALGFPKKTDTTGPVSAILNVLFSAVEKVADFFWPHSFYNFRLTKETDNAYQALAIDDERAAFWPHVWREEETDGLVEQVWFSGMHSNVGGGYGRSGTASIPLHWMMIRAKENGLKFYDQALQQAYEDSNEHGRIHDSRDGFAMMYRYRPREIEKLCSGRLKGNIRLHSSVIHRIKHRTANYTPGQLPGMFDVVESDMQTSPVSWNPGATSQWTELRSEIDRWVLKRKGLYSVMLLFLVSIAVAAFKLRCAHYPGARTGFWRHPANLLDYILPEWFDGLITYSVALHPWVIICVGIAIYIYYRVRKYLRRKTIDACERLRHLLINYESKSNG